MFSAVSSAIFAYRNVGKTEKGEYGRALVAVAQGLNVLNEVARYNKAIAKGTDAAVSVFDSLAKKSKVVDCGVKAVKRRKKNVNPLICASGALKVAMSDDKKTAAINEAAALTTMFAGERIAKAAIPKILEKIKLPGKMNAVVKGVAFVCASIASYSAGEYLGNKINEEIQPPAKRKEKIDQKA